MLVESDNGGRAADVSFPPFTIEGEAEVGQTLTAKFDGEGSFPEIQWERTDSGVREDVGSSWPINRTGDEYTLEPEDESFYIWAYVSYTENGENKFLYSDNAIGPVESVPDGDGDDNEGMPPLTGSVSVSGKAVLWDILSANTDYLDGTGRLYYRWQRSDTRDGDFTDISSGASAADAAYTLVAADAGKYIRVAVWSKGYSGKVFSQPVGRVLTSADTGMVTVNGLARIGETLGVTVLGGSGDITYQWQRSDTGNDDWTPINKVTAAKYTLVQADYGTYIRVVVSRTGEGPRNSEAVGPVEIPPLTGGVTISGTVRVLESLSALTFLEGDGAITYQWQSSNAADGTFTNIAGKTAATYPLAAADKGKYIRVTVKRGDRVGEVTSEAAGPVADPLAPGSIDVGGNANVGQILTVNIGALGSGTITYKWQRSNAANGTFTDITGAASVTYTLVAADAGKYIRAIATKASDVKTSEAVGPVGLPLLTGGVMLRGTAGTGLPLEVYTGLVGNGAITYKWQRADTANGAWADISGAASSAYTAVRADAGTYIRVIVSRAGYAGTTASEPVGPVLPALDGEVTINGNVNAEQTLTANTGALGGNGTIAYQWQRSTEMNRDSWEFDFEDIPGAVLSAYTPVQADAGKYIRVIVSRAGYIGTKPGTVGPLGNPLLTGTVIVGGNVNVEQTLTANIGDMGYGGTIRYQWQRSDTAGGRWTDISGATAAAYTLVQADQGKYVRVEVSSTGYIGTKLGAVGPVGLPLLTGSISVGGTAALEQTLTVDTALLGGGGTIGYQWQRSNAANGPWTNISGAASAAYTPVQADHDKYVRVTVSRTGYAGTKLGTVGPVLLSMTGSVTVFGNVNVWQTLLVDISDLGGSGTCAYQWQRSNAADGPWTDISGAIFGTYTPVQADQGKYVRVWVSRAGYAAKVVTVGRQVGLPILTGSVTVSGTHELGQTLTANVVLQTAGEGGLYYTWQRGDNNYWTGDIHYGQHTHTIVRENLYRQLRVKITKKGYEGALYSEWKLVEGLTASIMVPTASVGWNTWIDVRLYSAVLTYGIDYTNDDLEFYWQKSKSKEGPWEPTNGFEAGDWYKPPYGYGSKWKTQLDVGRVNHYVRVVVWHYNRDSKGNLLSIGVLHSDILWVYYNFTGL
jgi:hypothetical protein